MVKRIVIGAILIAGLVAPVAAQDGKNKIAWKKTVVDKRFRSEGVAVVDVNKDGKKDIVVGDVWYEAPDWKIHVLAKERQVQFEGWGDVIEKGWSPVGLPNTKPGMTGYSESFCVFADDFNGDGWPDVIVAPFPGKECYWYENPASKGGTWKQHLLTNSACNETPIFVDLFGSGKKHLVMAWQPPGKGNLGEMCYFVPGKDPTEPWQRVSISGPSEPKKEVPGTQRFSHGLGHGDVNGDGRVDIICTGGWWAQPERTDGKPWTFHAANLGSACADMYAFDMDGDGKADIISTSAHNYGMWWYQQRSPMEFLQRELFPDPFKATKLSKEHGLSADELALYNAINKGRSNQGRAPLRLNRELSTQARAEAEAREKKSNDKVPSSYKGKLLNRMANDGAFDPEDLGKRHYLLYEKYPRLLAPHLEVGVGVVRGAEGAVRSQILLGDGGHFSIPSQTHALHFVDINGDGQKDLVTGRRWWAHGPKGDAGPNDPAYIYWFEARKGRDGSTTFIPHEVDDDSGIGTSFAVEDIDGDGLPDIIVSNKRGVYVLLQVRVAVNAIPPRND